jgi:hypothetical protein
MHFAYVKVKIGSQDLALVPNSRIWEIKEGFYDFQYSRELFDPSSTTGNKVNGMMMPKARKVTKVLQRDRELGCKTLMLDHNLLLQKSLGIIILAPTGRIPCMSLLPQEPKTLAKGSGLSWNQITPVS